MIAMIGGSGQKDADLDSVASKKVNRTTVSKIISAPKKRGEGQNLVAANRTKEIHPEQVISMEDDDFQDF